MKTAAVIGLNWGIRSHLLVFRSLGWSIELLCGRDAGRTAAAARRLNVPRATTDLQSTFRDRYTLIAAAVPWWLHDEIFMRATGATSPVLLEHPIAPQITRVRQLIGEFGGHAKRLFVNMPSRYMHCVRSVAALIASGDLGSEVSVEHTITYPQEEERDWLSLLLFHSLDVANTLLDGRTWSLIDATADELAIVDPAVVPSWSWPITVDGGEERALHASSVSTTIRFSQGLYALRIARTASLTFLECVRARGTLGEASYQTELLRESEHSPWRSSTVWLGPKGATPTYQWVDSSDCWHAAQLDQADAISSYIDGKDIRTPPATIVDAAGVHELFAAVANRVCA
jgi:predicted dehydrogenase